MAEDAETLVYVCEGCGAEPAVIEVPDRYFLDTVATCKDCGVEFGTLGELREVSMSGTAEEIATNMKERLNQISVKFA